MMNSKWDEIIKSIQCADKIVIFTHTNMDGDALGSATALCHALRAMNKQSFILLEDEIPDYLSILNTDDDYYIWSYPLTADLAIAVDCGDESRIEKRLDVFKNAKKRICIDHHMQTGSFADDSVIEADTPACGILIYDLLKAMDFPINKAIADCLYAAISTDTGSFRFSNCNARAHEVIADLYNYGIDAAGICNAVYAAYPLCQLLLESIALEHALVFAGGRACISYVTKDDMKSVAAAYEHSETCIDRIRSISGIEIACMLKQQPDGSYKASLRSKDYADVNSIARKLGGGGHIKASGCTLNIELDDAIALLKKEIESAL